MAVAPLTPATAVTAYPVVVLPQQVTVPSAKSAQVCHWPAAIAVAPVTPGTSPGVVGVVVRPICLYVVLPQQLTVPSARRAQTWYCPAEIE
jgi:hypothetical protein